MLEIPNHPDADLALELLCSLPVEPDCVPIEDLTSDFGFSTQGRILTLIDELRERHYNIQIFRRQNGHSRGKNPFRVNVRCAAIAKPHSIAALADCENYWTRVHSSTV